MTEVRYVIKNKDRFMENKDGFIFEDPIYLPQFVGATSNPPDNQYLGTTNEVTVNPVDDMRKGDLCILVLQAYGSGASISDSGGQSWISPSEWNSIIAENTGSTAVHYCVFNGSWSSSIKVNTTYNPNLGTNDVTAVMVVFRSWYRNWSIDNLGLYTNRPKDPFQNPVPPEYYVTTIPAFQNTEKWNVSLAMWFLPGVDRNNFSWTGLSGSNWIQEGLSSQYRNWDGVEVSQNDGMSLAIAYQIATASFTASAVSLTQVPAPQGTQSPMRPSYLGFSLYAY